jgi:hypothetical protein
MGSQDTKAINYDGYPKHLIDTDDLARYNIESISRDHIPSLPRDINNPIVINLDNASGNGTHWTAFYVRYPNCFYYDPLSVKVGGYPPQELRDWAKRFGYNKIYCNDVIHMPVNSNLCGYFCIWFCKHITHVSNEKQYDALLATFRDANNEYNIHTLNKFIKLPKS